MARRRRGCYTCDMDYTSTDHRSNKMNINTGYIKIPKKASDKFVRSVLEYFSLMFK
jgi:hypothetical protein